MWKMTQHLKSTRLLLLPFHSKEMAERREFLCHHVRKSEQGSFANVMQWFNLGKKWNIPKKYREIDIRIFVCECEKSCGGKLFPSREKQNFHFIEHFTPPPQMFARVCMTEYNKNCLTHWKLLTFFTVKMISYFFSLCCE